MSPNKLTEFLDELESYLTDYADAEYDASSASGIPNREMSLLGSLEEVRTELKRNAAGIATQCPINKAATQCRFAINKVPPGTKLYTRPPLSQGVPEGFVLAERNFTPDYVVEAGKDCLRALEMAGCTDTRTIASAVFQDMLLAIERADSAPAAPQADEWVKCSERLPTEADAELESQPATVQLSELMRGLEISSGFLTMPPYIFYLTGKKIADQAKEATDAAILRKQAEAVEAIEAKYRPYGLSESYTAFAVSENLQAEANRLGQQATDLEEPPS